MAQKIFCLMGPTASGKTRLACELIKHFPFEIISVDSAMVYRGMDIGTAKPSAEELKQAPHHLIDIMDPPEIFSCARFCEEVRILCEDMIARKKIPLLTGGTMMYFNALQKGLSELPAADAQIRNQILIKAEESGWAAMHEALKQVDPVSAARIHPNDRQRIQRALEVYQSGGKTMSEMSILGGNRVDAQWVNLSLMPDDRSWLHERIALRFKEMLRLGFLDEVEHLLKQWPDLAHAPAMRSVGYRQAYDHLTGVWDYETFCNKGIAATRQLAKRQLTWLRHWQNNHVFTCDESGYESKIVAVIEEILDNTF